MVSKYLNRIRYSFEVVALVLKSSNDSKKFLIVGLVVILYKDYLLGLEGDKVLLRAKEL